MKVVLHEIRISCRDQGQLLRTRIRHVSRRVEPVLEKKEQAEHKAARLPLREEICSQKKWHEPLQQSASPKSKRRTKPTEQIVAPFMNNQVGRVDKQESAMFCQSIGHESAVEN